MKRGLKWAAMVAIGLCASGALADTYKVERSLSITTSPDAAWDMVGDFCDVDDWHPAITLCRLKVIDGWLHRILTLQDGAEIVEKRIAEEPGLSYTYSVVSSPFPIEKYTATVSITRGESSTINWSGRFASDDPTMEGAIAGLYEAGLTAIGARLTE